MSLLVGLLLFAAAAIFLYALIRIQDSIAEKLSVRIDTMAKNVGDTVTVTVSAVPAGAPITSVSVTASPAVFAPTADPFVFTCLQAATGVTISAQAIAADGSTVTGVSDPFDIAVPAPVVATSLVVAVA